MTTAHIRLSRKAFIHELLSGLERRVRLYEASTQGLELKTPQEWLQDFQRWSTAHRQDAEDLDALVKAFLKATEAQP